MHLFRMRRAVLGLTSLVATLGVGLVTATSAGAIALPFTANMTAAQMNAAGTPGEAGASGTASLSMDSTTNQICYSISWSGIPDGVVFGHIHEGQAGVPENPGFTVNLFGPNLSGAKSPQSGCVLAIPGQINLIELTPAFYLVTLHSKNFPVGAIRGQLVKG